MGYFNWSDGIVDKQPYIGIGLAHLKCIHRAKSEGWDKVLIMEDDVEYPGKDKTHKHIEECLSTLPDDWDIVLGGAYYLKGYGKVNAHWKRVGEFAGLHWYMVHERVYDRILQYDYTDHIDRWIGRQKLNIYLPHKIWAIQSDGFSDNVKKVTDYNSTYLTKFDVLR